MRNEIGKMKIVNTSRRKVLIRTDANPVIAGGHVMRCLSVADALVGLGADVSFVLSDSNSVQLIESRGFATSVLGSDWRDIGDGADELCRLCDDAELPIVLVDTYSVSREFVDCLAQHAKVCYLGSKDGDLGKLSLIINYSTCIDEAFYEETYGDRGTKLLFGPKYAPLRPCFASAYRECSAEIERVLVTTGNTDPQGFLPTFLGVALSDKRLSNITFTAVVGRMVSDDVAAKVELIESRSSRVKILRAVTDMAGLMGQCDAAVSANGTTVYELFAAGLPSVTFAMVEEQVQSAESLAKLGAVEYCGLMGNEPHATAVESVNRLEDLVASHDRAVALATRAHALVDGYGANKIAKEILSL